MSRRFLDEKILYTIDMISHLSGKTLHTTDKSVTLDVHGVGYLIYTTTDAISRINSLEGELINLWTHMSVRENAIELFGFFNLEELEFFQMLIEISGIGPRGALGIIGMGSVDTLKNAIASGDTGYLTKVSGIGRKTAEKIVLELKDKLSLRGHSAESGTLRSESDVAQALMALGYQQHEIRDALKDLPPTAIDTNSRIKEALKILGKRR